MTEYDYSPEAFERHMQTQARIARWVDDTQSHKEEFRNPFQYVPPTPQLGDTPLAPLDPLPPQTSTTRARSKSLHRPKASRSQTTPQPMYYSMPPPPPPQSRPMQPIPIPIPAPMSIPTQQQHHVRPHQLSTRSQTYAPAASYYPQQPHATMPPHTIIFQLQPYPQQYNHNINVNANQYRSKTVPVIPINPIANGQYQYPQFPGSNTAIPVSTNSNASASQMQMAMVPYQHPHQHQKQPLLQRLLSGLTGSNKTHNGRGHGNGKKTRKARRRSTSY